MPELNFNVYCGRCGNGLCNNTEVRGIDGEGYNKRYDEGYDNCLKENQND